MNSHYPNFTELRRTPISLTEVRQVGTQVSSSPGSIQGYAVKWNSPSEDLGGFFECVSPNCFDKSLRENADVRATINHSPDKIIGRTTNSTLRLAQDMVGLRFECDLPDTTYAHDLLASIRRADLNQCSFAFTDVEDTWDKSGDVPLRTIRSASLIDISCVAWPAYQATSVSVSSVRDDDNPFNNAEPWNDDSENEDEFNSIRTLWPCGVPVEVRSHIKDFQRFRARHSADVVERRRNLLLKLL